jgi:ribosomal protein S18 acetylase RimI-like enzyme
MLRAAIAEDVLAVTNVIVESRRVFLPFAPSPHTFEEVQDWVAQHLLPTGGVTVALVEGRVVAVLATSEDDSAGWIDQLYVLPGFDGQGLGTKLLDHAHASVKRPLRLFTFQQNAGARRFYERHGYDMVALSDGQNNEEKCPDVLYELRRPTGA